MKKIICLSVAALFPASSALATNGYLPHGIGLTAKGMGGVSIGYQVDSVALGTNPAASAFMQNRFDAGLDIFSPDRGSSISGNDFLPDSTFDGNESDIFYIPELGFRRGLNDKVAFGFSLFGHGGMNSDYKNGIPLLNGGTATDTGVNLMQLFMVPSVSFKPVAGHSFGVGLNVVAQGFRAQGLQSFDNAQFSSNPGKVTDNGTDWAYGAGIRLGWMGQLNNQWSMGATYQSRTSIGEFDSYSGLFAEQGGFDVPSNFGVGVAFKPSAALTLAADIVQINYSEINSIANSGQVQAPLGVDNGPGFGWEDITVIKLGIDYALTERLTLRGGFNHGDAPIPSSQTLFNILAPATVEDHITLGATWGLSSASSLTVAYMHALSADIKGSGSIPPGAPFGGGEADLTMQQNSIGLAFNWKL